jgi:hypothetical protein
VPNFLQLHQLVYPALLLLSHRTGVRSMSDLGDAWSDGDYDDFDPWYYIEETYHVAVSRYWIRQHALGTQ